ncbi:hypothetical protein ACH5RR_029588 [Cinchona calisaya]|uniref:Sulfotransferase n=1 Tax=Cinchona calisaya TaxID=153742 RepID=A0ABD2YVE4_9GENT
MAITKLNQSQSSNGAQNEQQLSKDCDELLSTLPKERGQRTPNLYFYQGFWCQPKEIQAIMSVQRNFIAQDSDIILATIPKSGTTWLKAISYAIVNRYNFPVQNDHPLLSSNPHELVPFLEYKLYADNNIPDFSTFPSPRLVATHVPFSALPESVKRSGCRVVYLARNPFDTFVSIWHYLGKLRPESLGPLPLEEAFDAYCRGVIGYGPYWDHLLGYWNESLEKTGKVLFLRYEEMKQDANAQLKRLAEFLGFPFSIEEEKGGLVENISNLCSFQTLKDLVVNKHGKGAIFADSENKDLFRKGKVGDWINYLTPVMAERLTNIMNEKLSGSNLSFSVL